MSLLDLFIPKIERYRASQNIDGLTGLLNHSNNSVRDRASAALGEIGKPAIKPLLYILIKAESPVARVSAGHAFGNMGSSAIKPLSVAIQNENDAVRKAAAYALGFADKPAIIPLYNALQDTNRDVRMQAAESLEKNGWKPQNNQQKILFYIAKNDWKQLQKMKKDAVQPLIVLLNDENRPVNTDAIKTLGRIKSLKAVPHLVKLKDNPNSEIRAAMIEALGDIGYKKTLSLIKKALSDNSFTVRMESAWALDKMQWKPKTDPERVRYLVAKEKWGQLKKMDTGILPHISYILNDDHPGIRMKTRELLFDTGDEGIRILADILNGDDITHKKAAAEALIIIKDIRDSESGSPSAHNAEKPPEAPVSDNNTTAEIVQERDELPEEKVERITASIADPDENIRFSAVKSLERIGEPASGALMDALENKHEDVRAAAADALGKMQFPAAVPQLISLLNDNSASVRSAAALALGNIQDIYALSPVTTLFSDPAPEVRHSASVAIAKLGRDALKTVQDILFNGTCIERISAVNTLGLIAEPLVFKTLILTLNDNSEEVRSNTVRVLTETGNKTPLPLLGVLLDVFEEGSTEIRSHSLDVLAGINDKRASWILQKAVHDPDSGIRKKAEEILATQKNREAETRKNSGKANHKEIRELITTLKNRSPETDFRTENRLYEIGAPVVTPLLESVDTDESGYCNLVSGIIGHIGDAALPALSEILQGKDAPAKFAAVRSLGIIDQINSTKALGWILYSEDNPQIRTLAAQYLGKRTDSCAVEPLAHAARDSDWKVRETAIRSLGKVGRVEAEKSLSGLLNNVDESVRSLAAEMLDTLKWEPAGDIEKYHYSIAKEEWHELCNLGSYAMEKLISSLHDPDEEIRGNAAGVLSKMGAIAVRLLAPVQRSEDAQIREGATLALGYTGRTAAKLLTTALDDRNFCVRLQAALSLDNINWLPPDTGAEVLYLISKQNWDELANIGVPALPAVSALITGEEEESVRIGAIKTLGEIKDASSISNLVQLINEKKNADSIRVAAVEALGECEARSHIPDIINLMDDDSPEVRIAATEALDRMDLIPVNNGERVKYLIIKENTAELAGMGEDACPHLIAALRDDQVVVRLVVTEALALMGKTGREALVKALDSGNARIRTTASEILAVMNAEKADANAFNEGLYQNLISGKIYDSPEEGIAEILPALSDPDTDVRVAAIEALKKISSPYVVTLLTGALNDTHYSIRAAAADALGSLKAKRGIPALIYALNDTDEDVRRSAALALGSIGDVISIPPLLALFSDSHPGIRSASACALAEIGTRAIEPVLEMLDKPEAVIRATALETLGRIAEPDVIRPVIRSFNDSADDVRHAAAEALIRLAGTFEHHLQDIFIEVIAQGTPAEQHGILDSLSCIEKEWADEVLRIAENSSDSNIREKAGEIIRTHSRVETQASGDIAEDIDSLIQILEEGTETERGAAGKKLQHIGRPAAGALLEALRRNDDNVRLLKAVSGILGNMGVAIRDDLITALKEDSKSIRLAATMALRKMPDRAAAKALGWMVYNEENPYVRRAAAESLGATGDRHAVKPLIHALGDGDRNVRIAAIRSLGETGDNDAAEPLIALLGDEDDYTCTLAMNALVSVGTGARLPLVKALSSGSRDFRLCVAQVLEALNCVPRDKTEKAYYLIAKERWYEVQESGQAALEPLNSALSDKNEDVRIGAVNSIAAIGGERAVELLISSLADESSIVRKRAESGLIGIGEPAVEALYHHKNSGDELMRAQIKKILRIILKER